MTKITIIGGDERLKIVEKQLLCAGYTVDTLGLYENDSGRLHDSRVLVFPVPTTRDGETVYTPLTKRVIPLAEIAESTDSESLFLTCHYRFPEKNCIDYAALDSYSLLNAVPTAEGAVKLAIEHTKDTLWQSPVLVIGYGRVGKILADRLRALGCEVTVSARKSTDFAMLEALGFRHIHTERLNRVPLPYSIIFNTVDATVLENETLKHCRAELILDLSTKGGFDLSAAADCGIRAIKAPGLPGIVAPRTAGKILAGTITELIQSHS